jgi:hypothetical protein
MKIIWRKVARNGSDVVVAFIDTEGLELGIDTVTLDPEPEIANPVGLIRGWADGESIEDDSDRLPPVTETDGVFDLNTLYFSVDTYQKLMKNPEDNWDDLLLAVNRFFAVLSEHDIRQLCLFFIDARRTIDRDLTDDGIVGVARDLGNKFYDLAVEINLPAKVLHFVQYQSGIPLPDLSYAGTNAGRDTAELTFCAGGDPAEYYILLSISIISKILFPICGDLVRRTIGDIDNMLKETHCINVIEPLLSLDTFVRVRDKLENYVANTIETEKKNSYPTAAFTAAMGGVSPNRSYHIVFSHLIVKRFVTIDLYTPVGPDGRNGNIIVWVATCSKQAFRSLQGTLNKNCRVLPRKDNSDGPEYEDERSVSVLEHSSRVTDVTADVPPMIRFGVRMAIDRLRRKYKVQEREFRQVVTYYQQNPIQVSLFNKILVGIFVGPQIGGAQGLKYLDLALYTELVAITQIYIATHCTAPEIAHLLTAVTPEEEKPVVALASVNARIGQNIKQSMEYRQCEAAFQGDIDGIGVGPVIRRLQDYVVKYHHFSNTAPFVCSLMEQDALPNGTLITYEADVMQQCCKIILQTIGQDSYA